MSYSIEASFRNKHSTKFTDAHLVLPTNVSNMLDKIKYIIGTIFFRGINSLEVCNGESPKKTG